MGTIDLTRDLEEWVPEVMERILRQIAIGLDIPAEILTGLADVNHWGQWLIDDSLRLNYVDPLVLDVLDSFTRGYLWPALQAQGVPDFERFLFWRDYSDLTSRTRHRRRCTRGLCSRTSDHFRRSYQTHDRIHRGRRSRRSRTRSPQRPNR